MLNYRAMQTLNQLELVCRQDATLKGYIMSRASSAAVERSMPKSNDADNFRAIQTARVVLDALKRA